MVWPDKELNRPDMALPDKEMNKLNRLAWYGLTRLNRPGMAWPDMEIAS